ncbi:N-acetylglucosamine kinase [Streptomyces marispadix]|uniref:ATPase n=1 Tax=Streptomyces marispadix TaxID=2922868 RepID=A0ABS9SVM9_9ACTN|nr:BadF/BadG/BcrA/BcrD ATPase family protein [Streptomyces marispadix]MCH6160316.1 ATPase [Streptomyces marispadix]
MGLTTVSGGELETSACLAIDAGNTKTDVAVVDVGGDVRGRARGGGFHPQAGGLGTALDRLEEPVARALAAAGVPGAGPGAPVAGPGVPGAGPSAGAGTAPLGTGPQPPVAHVSACLANADLPREERELTAALTARNWGRTTDVANDTFAILRAGLPDDGSVRHGVAVVCGAGVNCAGQDGEGRTHRFLALGRISGDFGGGGGLAAEAVWFAARAEDGRGEETRLARELPWHYGLTSMYALIEALHLGDLPRARMHEITPVLFEVASAGDPVARALVKRQAEELVTMVKVALTRLDLLQTPTPVLLGGSVAAARHPLLHDHFTRELALHAPKATPKVITAPPVLGSALLGLDAVGASPRAHARLRSHYA